MENVYFVWAKIVENEIAFKEIITENIDKLNKDIIESLDISIR